MVIALLVATAVLGAKPTFKDVLKKFPAATLPITIKEVTDRKVKLTAADVDALGFLKDTSDSLSELREWKKKPGVAGKKDLSPIAAIERPSSLVLLIQYDDAGPEALLRNTFLLSYDAKGTLLGGILFHSLVSVGESGETNVSTLDQAGVVSRLITEKYPPFEGLTPEERVVSSEARARVTSTGTLEVMPRAWWKRTGLYEDKKSNEELFVADKRVFYKADRSQPFQELEGDGNTMRLKGAPKPWIFTWNDRRSDISAQNPDGAVQVFTREW